MLLRLLGVLLGQGPKPDVDALDALVIGLQVQGAVRAPGSPIEGRDADEILAALGERRGPDRLVDLALRSGPYGDHFGAKPDGLTLDRLAAAPHGIDLGALEPRIPEVLRTPSGKIELAPELLIADLARLEASLDRPAPGLLLVGRRHVRSNNSWMHNLPMLAKGPARCTLQLHPDDAAERGLAPGAIARDLVARRQRRGARRDHRWDRARRRQPAARLGPRRAGHAALGGRAAPGHEQQRAHRRARARPALGHRGAERDPRRGGADVAGEAAAATAKPRARERAPRRFAISAIRVGSPGVRLWICSPAPWFRGIRCMW